MAKPNYLPPGYHNLTPALSFQDTERAMHWYTTVFDAKERMKVEGPDNKAMHAEMTIGDSVFFLAEENPQYDSISPAKTNGNSVKLHLYAEDVDGLIKKAVNNGAKLVMEPMDTFYGDRVGNIEDPFGYSWTISTHIKDVSEKEMREAAESFQPA